MQTDELTTDLEALVAEITSIEDAAVRLAQLRESLGPGGAREAAERLKDEADRTRYQDLPLSMRWCRDIVTLGMQDGDPTVVALGRMAEAAGLREQADYHASLACFDEAAALFRAHGDEVGWARAQIGRMGTCWVLGRFEEALERGLEARAILLAAGDILRVAGVDNNLAGLLERMNRPAEALSYSERALAAYRQAGSRYYALHTLGNHALLQWRLGHVREALAALQQAREGYVELGAAANAAQEDLHIGMAYLSLGYYAQAMRVLTDARRDLLAAGSPWLAALAGMSLVECLVSTGRFRDAIAMVPELHDELARCDDSVSESQALVWQARAYARLHEYDAALRTLDRAAGLLSLSDDLAIHRAVLEAERAELLFETGNIAEGLGLIQKATPVLGQAGLTIEAATAQVLQGSALLQMGRWTEANAAAGEALAVAEGEGLRWLTARALHLRGRVQIGQGDEAGARQSFASAVRHIDRVHKRVAWDDRATFTNTSAPLYADALALALRQQRLAVALRYADRCKASGLADHLRAQVDIRPRPRDKHSRRLIDELAALRERYAWLGAAQWSEPAHGKLAHQAMGPAQREESQAEVKRIERRLAEIWRELQVSNPAYRGEAAALDLVDAEDNERGDEDDVAQRWLDRVRAALGPNEDVALLEYAGLGDDLVLFVLRGQDVRTVPLERAGRAIRDLVPLLQLDVECSARAILSGGKSLPAMAAKTRGVLRRLHEILMEPATSLLDGVSRLVVVPHGAAHHVPFHALHNGQRYLIEDCEVGYAPCATLLEHFVARHRTLQSERSGQGYQALVATCSNGGALPQVEVEGQAVLEAFGGRLLREEEATLGALHALAGDYTVLHLAAHAVFRPDEPLFSSLQLYDGRLSTLEVFDLELSCSLATLSACETALGTAGAGDELMGLSRALLYAGAPSLVLSLWKVEDRSTSALMTRFYRALRQGASKAAALRAAQLNLIHNEVADDYSAPFYWAPFQLIGHAGSL